MDDLEFRRSVLSEPKQRTQDIIDAAANSEANSNLGKNYNYKTAKPHSNFKTAAAIPNGGTRTFNAAGSTNAYSDSAGTITIAGGDSVTRPKSIAIHFIIKHD